MRRKDREVTDIRGIEEILLQCKVCHVAMVDDGCPYVVPLSYGYKILDGNKLELYFHSALEGRKLDILKRNNKVCFEMAFKGEPVHPETPCNSGYYSASVIGFGEAVFITDADEKCQGISIMFKHQTGKDVAFSAEQAAMVCVFKIVSTDFTGKKSPARINKENPQSGNGVNDKSATENLYYTREYRYGRKNVKKIALIVKEVAILYCVIFTIATIINSAGWLFKSRLGFHREESEPANAQTGNGQSGNCRIHPWRRLLWGWAQ